MSGTRIGVAGAGVFGSYHASKIDGLDGAVLGGVFDTDCNRAEVLATKFKSAAFNDFTVFLDAVEAVVIATPAMTHFDLARQALASGKHILVEKPVATSPGAVGALSTLAASRNLIFQAGHQERYVCEATGLFSRDRAPQRIECVRHVPFTGRCGDVSVVMDLMVHDLDIIKTLTHSAEALNVSADGDQDNVDAELFFSTGTLASLSARRSAERPARRMTIVYDDGIIEFDFVRRTLQNSTPAPINSAFTGQQAPLSARDPLARGTELFLESILKGTILGVSGEATAKTINWADQIEKAAGLDQTAVPNLKLAVRQ